MFQVEKIVDEKVVNGVRQYLIRWKGYDAKDDTWEPEDTLNCPDLIKKFKKSSKREKSDKNEKEKSKKKSKVEEDSWDENEEFEVNFKIFCIYEEYTHSSVL